MDLIATIIHFQARQDAEFFPYTGRQVQAWFLREVSRQDQTLSSALHNGSGTQHSRPYTLSSLHKGPYPPKQIKNGDWCWVRLTALTNTWSEFFINSVLPDLLPIAKIGPVEFDVKTWSEIDHSHPRSGVTTYANLIRQAAISTSTRLYLDFVTPTAYKQKIQGSGVAKDVPLPIPEMVFGSLARNWYTFSEDDQPYDLGMFIEECVALNELKLRSERVEFSQNKSNRATTGFVGKVRYAILGNSEKSRFGMEWDYYASIIRALALYSFFSGSGQDTSVGLGQTYPELN